MSTDPTIPGTGAWPAPESKNAAGFSLVETLVAIVMMSIIAVTMWTVMKMYYDNIDLCYVNLRLQRTSDIAVNQIGSIAQQCSYTLGTSETPYNFNNTVADTCDTIHCVLPDGTDKAGYYIGNGFLWERTGAGAWKPFIVPPKDTVKVAGTGNKFYVTPDRKMLSIKFRMWMRSSNKSDTLSLMPSGVQFLCRN